MASLTKSQQLVYDYLCSTMAERAVPPSVREICAATGLRSTSTVHSHLKSLEALGYITRDAGLNRSIHIVGASAAKQVPILGKVTAGLPILAVEDIEGYIPYPDKSGKELFALHVDGLSMINAGILDGDYVIAEKTPVAENGEIVMRIMRGAPNRRKVFLTIQGWIWMPSQISSGMTSGSSAAAPTTAGSLWVGTGMALYRWVICLAPARIALTAVS